MIEDVKYSAQILGRDSEGSVYLNLQWISNNSGYDVHPLVGWRTGEAFWCSSLDITKQWIEITGLVDKDGMPLRRETIRYMKKTTTLEYIDENPQDTEKLRFRCII